MAVHQAPEKYRSTRYWRMDQTNETSQRQAADAQTWHANDAPLEGGAPLSRLAASSIAAGRAVTFPFLRCPFLSSIANNRCALSILTGLHACSLYHFI